MLFLDTFQQIIHSQAANFVCPITVCLLLDLCAFCQHFKTRLKNGARQINERALAVGEAAYDPGHPGEHPRGCVGGAVRFGVKVSKDFSGMNLFYKSGFIHYI